MRFLALFQIGERMDQRMVEASDVQSAIANFHLDKAELLCLTDDRGNRFDAEGNPERNPALDS